MSWRRTVLETLLKVTEEGAYANLALKDELSAVRPNDIGRSTALLYTTLEHLNYCDFIIAHYAKGRLHTKIRGILRMAAAELFFMDTPDHAVCSESVKLTAGIGKPQLKGFVNGVLRSIVSDKHDEKLPPLPRDTAERLEIETGYPLFIIKEHIERFGEEFTEGLLKCPAGKTGVRCVYPHLIEDTAAHLREKGVSFSPGMLDDQLLADGFSGIAQDEYFLSGKLTVQSPGAMLACRCLAPKRGMAVLDACAAPGGKTAYIFDLMRRSGRIVACDIHEHRLALIKSTLDRLHVPASLCGEEGGDSGVRIELRDASVFDRSMKCAFDAVLCDVPCSGIGGGAKPDARYRRTGEDVDALASLQLRILEVSAGYLKPGGALVYSTCTISEAENEGVVNDFLSRNKGFRTDSLSPFLPEALKQRGKDGMLTLFPNVDGTEGFFMARLVKEARKDTLYEG